MEAQSLVRRQLPGERHEWATGHVPTTLRDSVGQTCSTSALPLPGGGRGVSSGWGECQGSGSVRKARPTVPLILGADHLSQRPQGAPRPEQAQGRTFLSVLESQWTGTSCPSSSVVGHGSPKSPGKTEGKVIPERPLGRRCPLIECPRWSRTL